MSYSLWSNFVETGLVKSIQQWVGQKHVRVGFQNGNLDHKKKAKITQLTKTVKVYLTETIEV